MSDFPYMQFFAGDWTSDPMLSMCSPATRGIWMDALCAMHVSGRAGELSGTPAQLARVCRCLPAEMSTAIADLQTTKAADVTNRNGVVTLTCRRMKRADDKRKSDAQRQKKHRNGGVIPESPPLSHDGSGDVTDTRAVIQSSESEGAKAPDKQTLRARGTKEELIAYAVERGLSPTDGEWLFDKMLTSGWKVGDNAVRDWQALIRNWKTQAYFPSQKAVAANGPRSAGKVRDYTDTTI